MKKAARTRLIKPVCEPDWELTEPVWMGENSVNFYIPIWFNPGEYIKGIGKLANQGGINLYLDYCLITNFLEMSFVYKDEESDITVMVDMDGASKQRLLTMINRNWGEALYNN